MKITENNNAGKEGRKGQDIWKTKISNVAKEV